MTVSVGCGGRLRRWQSAAASAVGSGSPPTRRTICAIGPGLPAVSSSARRDVRQRRRKRFDRRDGRQNWTRERGSTNSMRAELVDRTGRRQGLAATSNRHARSLSASAIACSSPNCGGATPATPPSPQTARLPSPRSRPHLDLQVGTRGGSSGVELNTSWPTGKARRSRRRFDHEPEADAADGLEERHRARRSPASSSSRRPRRCR